MSGGKLQGVVTARLPRNGEGGAEEMPVPPAATITAPLATSSSLVVFGSGGTVDATKLDKLRQEIRGGSAAGGPSRPMNFDGSTKMDRRIKDYLHNYNSHIPDSKNHVTKQALMMEALALFFAVYPTPPLADSPDD